MATNLISRSGKGLPLSAADYDQNLESESGTVDGKTAGYTVLYTDQNKTIEFDSASPVICALTSTAALISQIDTTSFKATITNIGDGDCTIDPAGAELIDDFGTLVLFTRQSATIQINSAGTGWNVINKGTSPNVSVNNANGNPNVADNLFNVHSDLVDTAWETIGPTGSGADNIWSALNSVPVGVDWIDIRMLLRVSGTGFQVDLDFYARKNGSSEIAGADNRIGQLVYADGNTSAKISEITMNARIPVDGDVVFDAQYAESHSGGAFISLILTGYGSN